MRSFVQSAGMLSMEYIVGSLPCPIRMECQIFGSISLSTSCQIPSALGLGLGSAQKSISTAISSFLLFILWTMLLIVQFHLIKLNWPARKWKHEELVVTILKYLHSFWVIFTFLSSEGKSWIFYTFTKNFHGDYCNAPDLEYELMIDGSDNLKHC